LVGRCGPGPAIGGTPFAVAGSLSVKGGADVLAGALSATPGGTYRLDDTATALRDLEQRRASGKLVLITR